MDFCPREKSLIYQRCQKREQQPIECSGAALEQRHGPSYRLACKFMLRGKGIPLVPTSRLPRAWGTPAVTRLVQQSCSRPGWMPPDSPPAGHVFEDRPQNLPDPTKNVAHLQPLRARGQAVPPRRLPAGPTPGCRLPPAAEGAAGKAQRISTAPTKLNIRSRA